MQLRIVTSQILSADRLAAGKMSQKCRVVPDPVANADVRRWLESRCLESRQGKH